MDINVAIEKLKSLGVPESVIDTVKDKIDDGFVSNLDSLGLAETLKKYGVADVAGIGQDVLGIKDTDGDGKTGLAELADTAESLVEKAGLSDELQKAQNVVAEARGVDVDGDGKAGFTEAAGQAKDLATNVVDQVKNSDLAKQAGEKIAQVANSEQVAQAKEMAANVAADAGQQAQGLFAKIKGFFSA